MQWRVWCSVDASTLFLCSAFHSSTGNLHSLHQCRNSSPANKQKTTKTSRLWTMVILVISLSLSKKKRLSFWKSAGSSKYPSSTVKKQNLEHKKVWGWRTCFLPLPLVFFLSCASHLAKSTHSKWKIGPLFAVVPLFLGQDLMDVYIMCFWRWQMKVKRDPLVKM